MCYIIYKYIYNDNVFINLKNIKVCTINNNKQ